MVAVEVLQDLWILLEVGFLVLRGEGFDDVGKVGAEELWGEVLYHLCKPSQMQDLENHDARFQEVEGGELLGSWVGVGCRRGRGIGGTDV